MAERWHMVKRPDWLRDQLIKAAKYKDHSQRRAAHTISRFLLGEDIDNSDVFSALWALGCPHEINWGDAGIATVAQAPIKTQAVRPAFRPKQKQQEDGRAGYEEEVWYDNV